MADKLPQNEIDERLKTLENWEQQGDAIHKTFKFSDFNAAFGFMTRCAIKADQMDHHPDWSNVYNTVKVNLSTHDAGGLTELDFKLAAFMDRISA